MEFRYRHAQLEQMYQLQTKNRQQKAADGLQEFEVDVVRLIRLAYQITPKNIME